MRYSTKTVGGTVEILAADTFTGIPVCLEPSDTVYKAGTPIDEYNEAVLNGNGAKGILLYDVDTSINPNGTIVVAGVIDYNKIVANAGVTADIEDLQEALPAICFRGNINVQKFTTDVTAIEVDVSDTKKFTLFNGVAPFTVVSSDTTKATASESDRDVGVVGVAEGSATITVTDATGKKVSVAVTVTAD